MPKSPEPSIPEPFHFKGGPVPGRTPAEALRDAQAAHERVKQKSQSSSLSTSSKPLRPNTPSPSTPLSGKDLRSGAGVDPDDDETLVIDPRDGKWIQKKYLP